MTRREIIAAAQSPGALIVDGGGMVTCWQHAGHTFQRTGHDMNGAGVLVLVQGDPDRDEFACEVCAEKGGGS